MASTFFGLNIGYTGLQAANAAINTTGNNISNVETKGYSRQVVVQQAADALRTNTTYGMAGSGVDTMSIDQIRNQYYDYKYWNNNANLGAYDVKQYYMRQIEDYFTETKEKRGFGTIFDSMFSGLEEVFKSSGDDTKKSAFLSLGDDLCDYFKAQATNMQKLQLDVNSEIKNRVDQINSLAEQITTLNKEINTIEVVGNKANELRDRRNLLIDELSKIVDTEVVENPIYISESSNVKSGINSYTVRIAGGQILVNGYEYNTLECVAREHKNNQMDAEGLYDIKWSNGLDFNIYGKSLNGEIKGLIDVRDGNNEEYFHGKVENTSGSGTEADPYKVTIPANYSYLKDMNKITLPDNGVINLGGEEYEFTGWEFTKDKTTGEASYTFILAPTTSDPSQYKYDTAKVGTAVNYEGIPYYMEQMNEWVRSFAEAMNQIEVGKPDVKGAMDKYGNPAESLFTAKKLTEEGEHIFDADDTNPDKITSSGKSYYQMTALNVQMNTNMVNDVNKFGTTADIHLGQDAQDITEALMTVQNDKSVMSFRGCASGEFLQTILSDIALGASSANTFFGNFSNIGRTIENQRMSVSGVDNDEEALNLVKFQEAYNLSSKMIQVMTEIYDRLILSTGV